MDQIKCYRMHLFEKYLFRYMDQCTQHGEITSIFCTERTILSLCESIDVNRDTIHIY